MGIAFFRWEACEADAAVDALTFLADDPHVPQFRFKHTSATTVMDTFPSNFRLYSRYIFLHVFTALQMLMALFMFYLFNYLGTVRYYYASDDTSHTHKALGLLYLATIILGMSFVLCLVFYIGVVNSKWCISKEVEKLACGHLGGVQQGIARDVDFSVSLEMPPARPQQGMQMQRYESNGSRLRRIGARWISFARPYYAFPACYLSDFDYRHDIHVKYGAHATRRDPKCTMFLFISPFVFFLVIVDIVTIDEMRVRGLRVTLLQGLMVVWGPLLLLYMARTVLTRGLMCGRTCWGELRSLRY